MIAMNRPIFATGCCAETELAATADPGDSIFTVESSANFVQGAPLFIVSGIEALYLGSVQETAPQQLRSSLALSCTAPIGSSVWSPAAFITWPSEPELPIERSHHSGIQLRGAIGGQVHATRTAAPIRIDRLKTRRMSPGHLAHFLEWIEREIDGGLLEFTYVDDFTRVNRARLHSPDILTRRFDELQIELSLEIAILEERGFVR